MQVCQIQGVDPSKTSVALGISCKAFLVALALFCFFSTTSDVDIWGFLATGRLIADGGGFPENDPFSYRQTRYPWLYHEWLSSVVFYVVYSRIAPLALYIFKGILGISILLMIMRRCTRLTLFQTIFYGTIMAVIGRGFGMRPQIFTYFFFTLAMLLLEMSRRPTSRNLLFLMLPLIPVWSNLHGGFVAGIGIILIHVLDRDLRWRATVAGLLGSLLTAIHPRGFGYWAYMKDILSVTRKDILEWRSVFELPALSLQIILLLAICAFWVLPRRRRYTYTELACLGVTAFLAIYQVRHSPLLAICAGIILPRVKWDPIEDANRIRSFSKALLACLIGVFSLYLAASAFVRYIDIFRGGLKWTRELNETDFPVRAVQHIQDRGYQGNLAVTFEYGMYCIWKLYPAMKVSFDGRYEIYPEDWITTAFDFRDGRPGWERYLDGADYALVDRTLPPFYLLTSQSAGSWRLIYADEEAALFSRRKLR